MSHDPTPLRQRAVLRWWIRVPLTVLTLVTAFGAWYGTWYLISGAAAREVPIQPPAFLPGGWLLGGVALAVLVALPMTVAGVLCLVGSPRAPAWSLGAGLLLIGWIVIQVAFIGLVFFLQPAMFLVGALVAVLGWLGRRHESAEMLRSAGAPTS